MASSAIPSRPAPPVAGWLRVVNANPVTGQPALLGEFAPTRPALASGAQAGRNPSHQSLTALLAAAPPLQASLRALIDAWLEPTEFWLRAEPPSGGVSLEETRPLPLSVTAATRYHAERLAAGRIGPDDFLRLIPTAALAPARAVLDPQRNSHLTRVTRGTPISGGATTGELVAERAPLAGGAPRLVLVDRVDARHTPLLNDPTCAGVLALRGSPADHFALLARERGLLYLLLDSDRADAAGLHGAKGMAPFGARLTVDGVSGVVYLGDGVILRQAADPSSETARQLLDARESPVPLRLNVDSPADLEPTFPSNAAGIGLLRTEHLIRRGGLDPVLRRYLTVDDARDRRVALEGLAAFFELEFTHCLRLAGGRPVAIRLLDYPLHELGGSLASEVNPMLGLRGLRQGLRWPALYQTQIVSALRAALAARRPGDPVATVEVMAPLVTMPEEALLIRRWVEQAREQTPGGQILNARVGAMIETPAAAQASDRLASVCDFLSFGSNDLTQLLLGLSREDYLAALHVYRRHGLLRDDPFQSLHPAVVECVAAAARRARRVKPAITLGLCGAQAADARALDLYATGLLDYLSVSRQDLDGVKLQAVRRFSPREQPTGATLAGA